MDSTDETLKRLATFAGEGEIAWPDEPGITLRQYGPCFAGSGLLVRVLAEYDDPGMMFGDYPALSAEVVAAGRDYLTRHRDLFAADAYRERLAMGEDEGAALQADIRHLLALVKTPAESERLAALAAWDDEQHRFYHDADLVPGSARWEEQYATQAVLWGRLLRLLEAQRKGATDDNG